MRTKTGAEILDVFWFNADTGTAGLLVRDRRDPPSAWAGEWALSEFDPETAADVRAEALVIIEGGEVSRRCGS